LLNWRTAPTVKSESLEGRRWIGRVLRDRWRIDARISRGGVGTVYAATHKNNGSRAAIKVLHPEFARNEDTRSRFLQEGYAANHVNHPGVVRILDDDTSEDGHAYLVMELLEGEVLETRRIRKGGNLPLSDVYEVGEQLLDVLAAAHEKGIVHRDIKPDNLFVTQEGRLKVLDFGFAQMRSQFRPDVTATGFLLGTPGFMSPEQAVGNRAQVDAQTDIWAVGATLFTLISGEPVHDGQSAAEMLVAAANFPPRSLATVTSGLPPRLVELVDRAVAFDKASRWPSARAMQSALRAVSGKQKAGAVSRRSIPDVEPVSDGPTLIADPMFVEELDPRELADWQSVSWPNERRSTDRSCSHPADEDGDTVAVRSSTIDPSELAPHTEPPRTPQMSPYSSARAQSARGMVDPSLDGGTLIMERPVRDETGGGGAYPSMGTGPSASAAMFGPRGDTVRIGQVQPHPSPSPEPQWPAPQEVSRADEARYGASALQTASRRQLPGSNRALVFVAVVVVTMVVVIGAGLLILTFSD
jgi:eukaryotic-like serine/threonine-protein kinase